MTLREFSMRLVLAVFLAASLFATGAYAANENAGGLAPGKPSGIKQAQDTDSSGYWLAAFGVVAAIAVIGAAASGGKAIVNPTGTP
jgi:hypothetical protein